MSETLAARAGVDQAVVDELVSAGLVTPGPNGEFGEGDVRRVRVVTGLERGGIPRHVIGEAVRLGAISLDFVDQPSYDRFAADESITFAELSTQTGIPLDLALVLREAMGSPAPEPTDRLRGGELAVVPFVEATLRSGIRPALIERTLRVAGDGLRRLAETEADWWRTEILEPLYREGISPDEIGARTETFATELSPLTDEALLAIYHGQQAHTWMRNIFEGFEGLLARAGLHTRLERMPAICFFDVTGYSRLTEERGDETAAELAGRVARLVQRISADHGGRTIKWLGDGVMVFYPDPAAAVAGALEMMAAIDRDGLPPAHAGINAGPVLFQEGDYFGRTVNGAARIAERATRGEILVSEAVMSRVADAAAASKIEFEAIGPVELKGLAEPMLLYSARRRATDRPS
jgi:adenylate cyclase